MLQPNSNNIYILAPPTALLSGADVILLDQLGKLVAFGLEVDGRDAAGLVPYPGTNIISRVLCEEKKRGQ